MLETDYKDIMERVIVIIRVNSKALDKMASDLTRFSSAGYFDISFRIPQVTVLKRIVNKGHIFDNKPLLFNYGFLEIPIQYVKNPINIQELKSLSAVIMGYFYKTEKEFIREFNDAKEDGLPLHIPLLLKTVSNDEVERLFEVAKTFDVYDNVNELALGSYVVLKGYPFDGLGAKILDKKSSGHLRVELVDSGMVVEIDKGNVYYSAYAEEDIT